MHRSDLIQIPSLPVENKALSWAMRSRSVRLPTGVTSIRLENMFWAVLAEIAVVRGVTLSRLIAELCPHTAEAAEHCQNKASLLRLACLQYALKRLPDLSDIQVSVVGGRKSKLDFEERPR